MKLLSELIALTAALVLTVPADGERIFQTLYPTILINNSASGASAHSTGHSAAVTFQATLGLPRVNPAEFTLHSVTGKMSFAGGAASAGTNIRHLVGVHYEFGGQAGISGRSVEFFDGVAGLRDIDSLVDAFGPTIGLARGETYSDIPVTTDLFSDEIPELDPAAFLFNAGPPGQIFPEYVDFFARFGAVALGQYYNEASPLGAIAVIKLPVFEFVYELSPIAEADRLDWGVPEPSSVIYGVGEIDTLEGLDVTNAIPDGLIPSGDYDHNFVVDTADYELWASTYGDSGLSIASDGNGDGVVNAADYSIWRDNLGTALNDLPTPGVSDSILQRVAVPEPGSAALAILGFTAVLRHLRRA